MSLWLSLAKGPVAIFALGVLVLGLLRAVSLLLWDLVVARQRSTHLRTLVLGTLFPPGDGGLPVHSLQTCFKWAYFFASLCFPLGVLVCALFLSNHLSILDTTLGISWAALSKSILDWTAVVVILNGAYILMYRLYARRCRGLNHWRNSLLLLTFLSLFVSGYLAGRDWNPLPYNHLMLFHTLFGLATLMLVPFSRSPFTVFIPANHPVRRPALKHDEGAAQTVYHAEERSS
jgi:hypothetical protein